MPKYLIEREIPGAGKLSQDELRSISINSCNVISEMGPKVQWLHSYVSDDKVYCVYIAENKDQIVEHAQKGGFPTNVINTVASIIDPTTAE